MDVKIKVGEKKFISSKELFGSNDNMGGALEVAYASCVAGDFATQKVGDEILFGVVLTGRNPGTAKLDVSVGGDSKTINVTVET